MHVRLRAEVACGPSGSLLDLDGKLGISWDVDLQSNTPLRNHGLSILESLRSEKYSIRNVGTLLYGC